MKPTAIKFIMVPFFKNHLFLIRLDLKLMQLAQMDQRNGILIVNIFQKVCNHFGLLTIFLVLEEQEMM